MEFETTDPAEALKQIRVNREIFRALRRVVLERQRTTVYDINGDAYVVQGVGWETEGIGKFLHGVGASFDPAKVNLAPLTGEEKEYRVVKSDPWGQDRIL